MKKSMVDKIVKFATDETMKKFTRRRIAKAYREQVEKYDLEKGDSLTLSYTVTARLTAAFFEPVKRKLLSN